MYQRFILALFRNPKQIGAVVPSSQSLARAMASEVDLASHTVLELGPGTGVITQALLSRGIKMQQLILLERDGALAGLLSHRFPDTRVIEGDASKLENLICSKESRPIDTVVSSLPLLNMKREDRLAVLQQVFSVLDEDGKLIQFTYSAKAPIQRELASQLDVKGRRVTTVLKNLPPASVWIYGRSLEENTDEIGV